MKKLLMSLAFVGSIAAMSAKADSYMFWMVDLDDSSKQFAFDNAELRAYAATDTDFSGSYTVIGAWETTGTELVTKSGSTPTYGNKASYLGDSWTYMVELYNGDQAIAKSTTGLTWSQIQGFDAVYSSTAALGHGTAVFATFSVPEPTSGLLMLLGVGLLGLKRKKLA